MTITEIAERLRAIELEIARLQTQFKDSSYALSLQTAEYQRHFDELNHTHQTVKETLSEYGATYFTIAAHEMFRSDIERWRSEVDKRLAADDGRRASLTAIVSAVIAIASMVFTVLNYFNKGLF